MRLDGPFVSKSLYISSGRGRHQPQLPNDRSTEEWIRTERQLLNVIVINLFSLIYESTLLCLPLCYWNWTQFSSVAQSCPTLCYPMDSSTPVFPVLHQLLEPAQTCVHWVGDALQPSHPPVIPFSSCLQSFLASGSFQMCQFFSSGGQSIGVSVSASVLPVNIQDWFPLERIGLILQFKGLSRVFSNTTVQKHQSFGAQLSL